MRACVRACVRAWLGQKNVNLESSLCSSTEKRNRELGRRSFPNADWTCIVVTSTTATLLATVGTSSSLSPTPSSSSMTRKERPPWRATTISAPPLDSPHSYPPMLQLKAKAATGGDPEALVNKYESGTFCPWIAQDLQKQQQPQQQQSPKSCTSSRIPRTTLPSS